MTIFSRKSRRAVHRRLDLALELLDADLSWGGGGGRRLSGLGDLGEASCPHPDGGRHPPARLLVFLKHIDGIAEARGNLCRPTNGMPEAVDHGGASCRDAGSSTPRCVGHPYIAESAKPDARSASKPASAASIADNGLRRHRPTRPFLGQDSPDFVASAHDHPLSRSFSSNARKARAGRDVVLEFSCRKVEVGPRPSRSI